MTIIQYGQSTEVSPWHLWIPNIPVTMSIPRWASLSPFSAAVPWLPPPSFACWALPSASAPGKKPRCYVSKGKSSKFFKLCESFWPKTEMGTCQWLVCIKVPDLKPNDSTSGTCCWCAWLCWWLKAFSCFSSAFKLANLSPIEQVHRPVGTETLRFWVVTNDWIGTTCKWVPGRLLWS